MKATHALGGCLTIFLVLVGGCSYMIFFHSTIDHQPPRVIGVRIDAQGNVLQKFVFQGNAEQRGWFPGPHGPVSPVVKTWNNCFIREPGKPDRELPFLRDVWLGPSTCRPVADSQYWVMLVADKDVPGIYRILAFDDSHILRNRDLPWEHDFSKDDVDFFFRDGNRKVIYRTAHGFEEYNVLTDAAKPSEKPSPLPEDDPRQKQGWLR
jgi:hypothetical protein